MEQLLKAPEAAKLLNLSLQGVFRCAREGVIPVVRIGRHMRFSPQQLQAWIEQQSQTQQSAAGATAQK